MSCHFLFINLSIVFHYLQGEIQTPYKAHKALLIWLPPAYIGQNKQGYDAGTNNPKISVAQQMTVCASLHATSPSQVEREPYMFYFSGTQTNGDFTLTYVSVITSTVRMTCGKLTLILHLPLRSNTCLLRVTHISSAYISSAKTSHMGYNYLQRGQRQAILLSVWEAES